MQKELLIKFNTISDKNSLQRGHRGNIYQPNEGHLKFSYLFLGQYYTVVL